MLSTIEAYLSGKKELFKGLAIEKLEQEWEEHPILHLDLNTENYKEPDSLRRRLDSTLIDWAFQIRKLRMVLLSICYSNGRSDVVLQTKDYIYVMELKLDGSADEALRQIEEKGYALPFVKDSRKLYKVGVNFSSETCGIEEWKIVEPSIY